MDVVALVATEEVTTVDVVALVATEEVAHLQQVWEVANMDVVELTQTSTRPCSGLTSQHMNSTKNIAMKWTEYRN